MSGETPEQVLKSIVEGLNTGNLDALMTLYEPEVRSRSATSRRPGGRTSALRPVSGSAGIVLNRWARGQARGQVLYFNISRPGAGGTHGVIAWPPIFRLRRTTSVG